MMGLKNGCYGSRLKIKVGFSILLVGLMGFTVLAEACEPHWIKSIYDCGEVIQLDDMSLWRVHGVDLGQSKNWKPGENVLLCEDEHMKRIKNIDRTKDKTTKTDADNDDSEQGWVYINPIVNNAAPLKSEDCPMKKKRK